MTTAQKTGGVLGGTTSPKKPIRRTEQQNRALHLGCEMIAAALNDAGLDMRVVLKPDVSIPWTKESVKAYMFKPVMTLMTTKSSTTELAKNDGEIEKIWDTVMRFLAQNHGIEYIPFPSHAPGYADTAPLKSPLTPVRREVNV